MSSNGLKLDSQKSLAEACETIASIEDQLFVEAEKVTAGLRSADDDYFRWVKRARKALRRAQSRQSRLEAEISSHRVEVSCPQCGAKVSIL